MQKEQTSVLLQCERCRNAWAGSVLMWEEFRVLGRLLPPVVELVVPDDATLEERDGTLYHRVRDHSSEDIVPGRHDCGSVRVIAQRDYPRPEPLATYIRRDSVRSPYEPLIRAPVYS